MRLVGAGTRDLPYEIARRLWWDLAQDIERQLAARGLTITRLATGVTEVRRAGGNVDLAALRWGEWRKKQTPGFLVEPFPYPTVEEMVQCGVDLSTIRGDPRLAAGPIRNGWMADWAAIEPDGALGLIHTGLPRPGKKSSGSLVMRREAQRTRLHIFEVIVHPVTWVVTERKATWAT